MGRESYIISAYPNASAFVDPTCQPRPDFFQNKKKTSSYKQNNKGEITPPCFTLFETGKLADFATPQST